MVKAITDVATNKSRAIVVDKKLIDGSGSDEKGKLWIPAILGLQVKLTEFCNLRFQLTDLK